MSHPEGEPRRSVAALTRLEMELSDVDMCTADFGCTALQGHFTTCPWTMIDAVAVWKARASHPSSLPAPEPEEDEQPETDRIAPVNPFFRGLVLALLVSACVWVPLVVWAVTR